MPLFLIVSEIYGRKVSKWWKIRIFSNFLAHPVETPWPSWRFYIRMCAGLCPTYWTTFGNAEKNRNGSCPMHEWDHPPFFEFLIPPPPAPRGRWTPQGGGTSANIVPTQIIFRVDPSTRCWDIAPKRPKCKNSPLTPIVTKISFPPFPSAGGR